MEMFDNSYFIRPPGTIVEILSHPIFPKQKAIELALFNEHRYAFFFWNKWTRELHSNSEQSNPPCLVSLDWHHDLGHPEDNQKKELESLDLSSNREVSLFTWEKLNPLNDTQIMSAAYLNLIGNIYIQCRQNRIGKDWQEFSFLDRYGNPHMVKLFHDDQSLEAYILTSNENAAYFDIDLDFFTLNNPLGGVGEKFTYLSDKEIKNILDIKRPLIKWIFTRLAGMTIAIEPKHSGGLENAHRLLNLLNKIYFLPGLFSSGGEDADWKHFKSNRIK